MSGPGATGVNCYLCTTRSKYHFFERHARAVTSAQMPGARAVPLVGGRAVGRISTVCTYSATRLPPQ